MKLFDLLPEIIRLADSAASHDGVGSVEKWMDSVEGMYDDLKNKVDGLKDLIDPDVCEERFLPLLAELLNAPLSGEWDESVRRFFLKNTVLLWLIKGTAPSIRAILKRHGYPNHFPWELWKTKDNEDYDYSLFPDYNHTIKAARFDIRTEEQDTQPPYQGELAPSDKIEPFRPIHVLVRRDGSVESVEGHLGDVSEVPTCYVSKETIIDGAYGFSGAGATAELTCTHPCQVQCQTGCFVWCQTGCTLGACETDCQTYCMNNCQENAEGPNMTPEA